MTVHPSLFSTIGSTGTPLAHRMRPKKLGEFLGQEQLLGIGKPLREAIERGIVGSMVLWGPPGSGKTTLQKYLNTKLPNYYFTEREEEFASLRKTNSLKKALTFTTQPLPMMLLIP